MAWEGRTDDFLDGEALAVAHCCGICDCRRGGRMSLVRVDNMGYECREGEDVRGVEEIWALDEGEGEV